MVFPVKKEVDGVLMTGKEELFVNHPDALTNPRKAALDCGYSRQYAEKRSYELRQKFRDVIVQKIRDRLDAAGVTDGRLLKELGALALYNVVDAYEEVEITVKTDGGEEETRKVTVLKDLKKLPEELQRAVKKIKHDTMLLSNGRTVTYVAEIEFHDKLGALRDFLKVRGIYEAPEKKKPAEPDRSPLEDLSVEELEEIAEIHERARKRLAHRASSMRDSAAIEGEVVEQE